MAQEPETLHLVTSPVPGFSSPPRATLDPPLDEVEEPNRPDPTYPNATAAGSLRSRLGSPFGLGSRRPATPDSDTPTGISSPAPGDRPIGKADLKLTGELVAVVVGAAFVGLAAVVRMRKGRKLRQPTKTQLGDIGKPLGRIAGRHLNPEWLNADLIDIIEAGSAVAGWAAEGPLTVPDKPNPTLPGSLPEEN